MRRSGGSLATLYELFENKTGLLRALVGERCSVISDTIEGAVLCHRPPRDALREVAEHMFDKIVDAEFASLFKAALVQPDLGPQMYEAGPARAQATVANYLDAQVTDGAMTIEHPLAAAQMFLQMMFGHYHQMLLFGLPVKISEAEKAAHIDCVLDAFFKVYGAKADIAT